MVADAFNVTLKVITGGTCSCSSDVLTITGGTCTALPYQTTIGHNGTRDLLDYTAFGDKIRKNKPGFPGLSLDISGYLDLSNAVQLGIWNSQTCSTPATRVMRYYDGNKTVTVKGYLGAVTGGHSVGAISTFSTTLTATMLPKTC